MGQSLDRVRAKEYVKDQLEGYLQGKGINTRKPFNCLNPEHVDNNPSMSYDRKRNKVHCFANSCGADYDLVDIIGIEYNLNIAESFNKAYELYNISLSSRFTSLWRKGMVANMMQKEKEIQYQQNKQNKPELTDQVEEAHKRVNETDYFHQRGLSEDTINCFKLGYNPDFKTKDGNDNFITWKAVIIPTGPSSYTARNINSNNKNDRIRKRGGSPIYNTKALQSGRPVFITEGELDALSVIEAGAEAIALGSTANADHFIKLCKEQKPAGTLLLALDSDTEGQMTTEGIIKELKALEILFLKVDIVWGHKDPNEHLIANREGFIKVVNDILETLNEQAKSEQETKREQYLKGSTANYLQKFISGITECVDTPYIPTGFSKLDKILDGGLYEGLYILGAISSLGKTTFILQVADQIAQGGQDILIFSLEMARTELMAKSISRLSFELSKDPRVAKTTRGITTGKRYLEYNQTEKQLIKNAISKYGEYAKNIYISEGMGNIGTIQIRETVKEHITLTGNKPVVIIDYLQLLAPYDPRSNDKRNTDNAVMELKRISRDHKIPVIAISSFNRQNYNYAVTMEAFKESGGIEYSSDILMGIQAKGTGNKDFDLDAAKKKDPREIEIKILKNRNGAPCDTIDLEYYPLFNYFKEG